MKPYEKTASDASREQSDMRDNPIMRWLQNQDAFKFNIGDILIKKTKNWIYNPHSQTKGEEWNLEVITKATGAPRKYVYAFENALGIGYLRQLKVDGKGYCGTLICVANFDPDNTRLELDPDFVDHSLIGEGDFDATTEYAVKKKFRQEAMAANRKLLVKTTSKKQLAKWFTDLKSGDEFWYGTTFDELAGCKYKVVSLKEVGGKPTNVNPNYYGHVNKKSQANIFLGSLNQWRVIEVEVLETTHPYTKVGSRKQFEIGDFHWQKVTTSQPHPMKDELCGPPK